MKCGTCGCSITAEEKRKKSGKRYVYYHCTNGKGICSNIHYIREENIETYFKEALSKIQISEEIIDYTRQALVESSKDERDFRESKVKTLSERYTKLDHYISQCYQDKLDNKIEPDLWESKTEVWKREQADITSELDSLRSVNTDYMLEGIKLMNLAKNASGLFEMMNADEKREILSLVLSNPTIQDATLQYSYKQPFKMFENIDEIRKWRERRDSNSRPPA